MPDPLAVLKARARFDPLAFAKLSPNTVPDPYAPFHKQLTSWPTEPGTSQARVVFRGAAKTTLTRMLVMWAIWTKQATGIVWIRATGPDTIADRDALEQLAKLYGFAVERHNLEQKMVVGGVPVWTKSPRNPVRGVSHTLEDGSVVRPSHVIVDDVETEETSRSKTQTDQLERFLFSAAFETGDTARPVSVIMLGTPLSPTALISKAIRREPPFDTWQDPLVVPVQDENGDPAWPAKHDPTKQTRVPAITWATEHMLETVPTSTVYFPQDRTIYRPTPASMSLVIGVDPAGDGDDATGIAAVGLLQPDDISEHGGLHIADAEAWTGPANSAPGRVKQMIDRLHADGHTVSGVLVEANKGPWQYFVTEVRSQVAPVRVQSQAPKRAKGVRALPFTVWQQNGQLSMSTHLRGTPADTELHTFTVDEQTVTGHDDVFDAIVWACDAATGVGKIRPKLIAGIDVRPEDG